MINLTSLVPIEGYKDYYCDIQGNVYRWYANGNVNKLTPYDNGGYVAVKLYNDTVSVGKIIAETFLKEDKEEAGSHAKVYHLDGDPNNNAMTNLVWATPKEIRQLTLVKPENRLDLFEEMRGY